MVRRVRWAAKNGPPHHLHCAPMNCREFRRKHDAFIDDTLSGVDVERMASHRRLCASCAQLDTRVRRALLIARNLPTIDVSPAFAERLQARLSQERAAMATLSGMPNGLLWKTEICCLVCTKVPMSLRNSATEISPFLAKYHSNERS